MDKKTKQVICTAFANAKHHDFRLFKKPKTKINTDIKLTCAYLVSRYTTAAANSYLAKKKISRKTKNSQQQGVINENVAA